ncbi:MAG: phosphoglycerate dehydrogenase [Dehalococcoidia bacterium]|nr:phosphoglycerate dehydrogenase [Dehalococcoidia bacterium]
MKVLVSDPVDKEGVDILIKNGIPVDVKTGLKPEELIQIIPEYDGLLVRSETKVTADIIKAAKKLQIIGRAGVGVDNIDLKAATDQGIIVVNSPDGNTLAAAELTVGLMFALARHIPQAHAKLKAGKWDRKSFVGIELRKKKLGIIGLGRIGTEVAKRCKAMDMEVLGYDPVISPDLAKSLGVKLVSLDEIVKESDFITVHVPLNDATRGMIGEEALKKVKPSVRLINVARGGVIDEAALAKAVDEGRVAGAAIDVYTKEPATENILIKSEKIVTTPHLGASTTEAQTLVAVDVAEQVVDVLLKGLPARSPVNLPRVSPETMSALSPFVNMAYLAGKLAVQIAEGQMSAITIKYEGDIAGYQTDAIKAAVIGGLLESTSEDRVNQVNANIIAQRRGLKVVEQKNACCENYTALITVEVETTKGTISVAGTVMRGEPHIVKVNDYWLNIVPTGGHWLFADHMDRPGLIAAVSTVTGEADINISSMSVARLKPRGKALMVLALDEPLSEAHLKKIMSIKDIHGAKAVTL